MMRTIRIQGRTAELPECEFRIRSPHSTFRIGIPDDYFFSDLHPETEAAYRAAIKTLGEIGFELRDVSLPGFEVSEKASAKILLAEAAAYHLEHIEQHADQIGEDVLTRFKWGLDVTGVEYALARRTQVEWRHKMDATLRIDRCAGAARDAVPGDAASTKAIRWRCRAATSRASRACST